MVCGDCVVKLALRLVRHHKTLDLIRALELAEKGVERVEKRGKTVTKEEEKRLGFDPDYSQSCVSSGSCTCKGSVWAYLEWDDFSTYIIVDDSCDNWSIGDTFFLCQDDGQETESRVITSTAPVIVYCELFFTTPLVRSWTTAQNAYARNSAACSVSAECRVDVSCACACPDPLPNSDYVSDTCSTKMTGCACLYCDDEMTKHCIGGACTCGCAGLCYYDCVEGYEWNGEACVPIVPPPAKPLINKPLVNPTLINPPIIRFYAKKTMFHMKRGD